MSGNGGNSPGGLVDNGIVPANTNLTDGASSAVVNARPNGCAIAPE